MRPVLVPLALVLGCGSSHHGVQNADATATADAAPPCPTGLGERFVCDPGGAARVRCVDDHLESVACPSGCTAGTGGDEATCACGASAGLTRWNCGSDGDLHSCAGGLTLVSESCGGRGCMAQPLGVSDTCTGGGVLQAAVDQLGVLCDQYSPGTMCSLAVRDLVTGAEGHFAGNAFYVSASSAKAIWVAAALYDRSIADVMPYATPVFRDSDNDAAGFVIDLLASPDRVNTFMWNDVQLPDSGFCHWNTTHNRDAATCPSILNGDNFFTADDALRFATALWDRTLLGDSKARTELDWMLLSPRSGYGGWLGTQLPTAAQGKMHHKAGWLPPEEIPGYSNSNELGVVEIPGGHPYAVAILMNGGTDYDHHQLPMMEFASCIIYHAVAGDSADGCVHP